MQNERDEQCLECGASLKQMDGCRHTYGTKEPVAPICTGNLGRDGNCLKCGLPMCPGCGRFHTEGFCHACQVSVGVIITPDGEEQAINGEMALRNLLAEIVANATPAGGEYYTGGEHYRVHGDLIRRAEAILNQA